MALNSGRDAMLNGAQVSGNKVTADIGRDLLISSQQDSDRYDSKQTSFGAGGSFTFGSMSGSGYISLSQDKMRSRYNSVQEQSGIFAGEGGFDITTDSHTQLNGAVIASTAEAGKNRLDTGTLGFSDIGNAADYKVSHSGISAGMSSKGSPGGQLLSNALSGASGALLARLGGKGHAEGTTQSAVADGTITLRNQQQQQQNLDDLSRDTEHANGSISPIFDKEKEQKRLQMAQMAGEIAGQMSNIVQTQGDINGLEAAKAAGVTGTAKELRESPEYKKAQRDFGTGGKWQRVTQSVSGILTGLAGGNAAQAAAGGLNPWVAQVIKQQTTDAQGNVNVAANAAAHAVWGAVAAQMAGGNAAAGAAGAFSGELAARYIAEQRFGADTQAKIDALSEAQRQELSLMSTLAAGLAGGLAGNSTTAATTGAQAGKNAVENNLLGGLDGFGTGFQNNIQAQGSLVNNTNLTDENGKVLNPATPEEIKYISEKLVKGDLPEGANITKVIVDGYKDGVLMAGAGYLGPAASVGKAVGGAVIAEIANGSYQWFALNKPGNENKGWDYKGSVSAGITGALAPGRNVWQNAGIAASGTFFTDGPDKSALAGTGAGWAFGTTVGIIAPPLFSPVLGSNSGFVSEVIGSVGGEFIGNIVKDEVDAKGK